MAYLTSSGQYVIRKMNCIALNLFNLLIMLEINMSFLLLGGTCNTSGIYLYIVLKTCAPCVGLVRDLRGTRAGLAWDCARLAPVARYPSS